MCVASNTNTRDTWSILSLMTLSDVPLQYKVVFGRWLYSMPRNHIRKVERTLESDRPQPSYAPEPTDTEDDDCQAQYEQRLFPVCAG